MEQRSHESTRTSDPTRCPWAGSISRRALLKGSAATGLGVAAGALSWPAGHSAHAAGRQSSQPDWQQFDAALRSAMQTFGVVGSAVAVVNSDGFVHGQTFGVRDLAGGAPVTPGTLFGVGSTTKSMTSLLVATFVDDGTLAWDQPVIDAWPAFLAPTDELTQTLRVRDLLGMDSGLGAPPATDDPRPYTDDYATGYALDFVTQTGAEPLVPQGSFAPAGGTLASLSDMAAYISLQLRSGVSLVGTRVVSAPNLTETHLPGILVPSDASGVLTSVLPAESTATHYCQGWFDLTFPGGRRFISHGGAIDGFTCLIGFFPEDNVGLVVLTNSWTGGSAFYNYLLSLFLSARFGLNTGIGDAVISRFQDASRQVQGTAAQARPVDPTAIAPYLGYHEHGYQLAFDAIGVLRIRQSSRATRVLAMPDGAYVAGSGILAGSAVRLSRDSFGNPQMEIEGAETVRWQSGLE